MAITYTWTIPTCEHDIAEAVHTQAVKDAYAAHLAAQSDA